MEKQSQHRQYKSIDMIFLENVVPLNIGDDTSSKSSLHPHRPARPAGGPSFLHPFCSCAAEPSALQRGQMGRKRKCQVKVKFGLLMTDATWTYNDIISFNISWYYNYKLYQIKKYIYPREPKSTWSLSHFHGGEAFAMTIQYPGSQRTPSLNHVFTETHIIAKKKLLLSQVPPVHWGRRAPSHVGSFSSSEKTP